MLRKLFFHCLLVFKIKNMPISLAYLPFEPYFIKLILVLTCLGAIWDKSPECIFENFEIARVKRREFQNFQKCARAIYLKLPPQTCDYWLITPNKLALCTETKILYRKNFIIISLIETNIF